MGGLHNIQHPHGVPLFGCFRLFSAVSDLRQFAQCVASGITTRLFALSLRLLAWGAAALLNPPQRLNSSVLSVPRGSNKPR